MNGGRSMRAVKGSRGHSFKERCRKLDCARSTLAVGDQSVLSSEEKMSGIRSSLPATIVWRPAYAGQKMFLPLSSSRYVAVRMQGPSSSNGPAIAPLCRVDLDCFVCPSLDQMNRRTPR
jgi:hypothetical protein